MTVNTDSRLSMGEDVVVCLPVSRARSSPVPEVVAYFRHGYGAAQE